ncbi:tol-pal system protein YbgF [Dongia deserti]|uniref:tol-pal system protein YbgF n=1 Tax=Dongia deserti TaxID=2268030 RepID=UPI0013C45F5F|nr:tol-pal system protein YbgF [Dongia deserti]
MVGHATRGLLNRGGRLVAGSLALVLAIGIAGAAHADEVDDLRREVQQLKQQVLYLQNQIPGVSAGTSSGGGGNLAAQQQVQAQEFQRQLTGLTGHIERVELKLNEVAAQLERMQKDTEYRLGILEGGGGAMGTTTGAATPGADAGQGGAVTAEPIPPNTHVTVDRPQSPPAPAGQPGVLGTLSSSQAANLPQAPAGAAEAAAQRAGEQTAMQSGQAGAGALPGATPREQYEYATNLIQRGAYDQAETALKAFVEQHPKDPLTGNAQYWLGETYYVRNDFKNAAIAFAEGYQKYPDSQKAPDNLLKLAMALGQQGQKENACVALRQLEKRYPDASANVKDRATRAKKNYSCS